MLPGVDGTELVIIAIVALLVVGPKDLPVLMRKIGQFLNKLRGMAAEFRASFDEMARQSELDELRKEVEALRSGQLDPIRADLDATGRDLRLGLEGETVDGIRHLKSPDAWDGDYDDDPAPKKKLRAKAKPKSPAKTAAKKAATKPKAKAAAKAPAKRLRKAAP